MVNHFYSFRVKLKGAVTVFLVQVKQIGHIVISRIICIGINIGRKSKKIISSVHVRFIAAAIAAAAMRATAAEPTGIPLPPPRAEIHQLRGEAQTWIIRRISQPIFRAEDMKHEPINKIQVVVREYSKSPAFGNILFGQNLKIKDGGSDGSVPNKIIMEACKNLMYQSLWNAELRKQLVQNPNSSSSIHQAYKIVSEFTSTIKQRLNYPWFPATDAFVPPVNQHGRPVPQRRDWALDGKPKMSKAELF